VFFPVLLHIVSVSAERCCQPAAVQAFAPFFDALVDSADASGQLSVKVRIFVTNNEDKDGDDDTVSSKYVPRHCFVSLTKPSMSSLLLEAVDDAINPCHTCVDCRCGENTRDGLCPGGGDDCCNDAAGVPAVSKIEEGGSSDEVVVAEKNEGVKECTCGSGSGGGEKRTSARPTTASTCCKSSEDDDKSAHRRVTASAAEALESKAVRGGGMSVCACGPRRMLVHFVFF
jgi:hypothetical protein